MLKKDPKRVSAAANGMKVRVDARRVVAWRSGGRMLRKLKRSYYTKCAPREVNMDRLVNESDLVDKDFFLRVSTRIRSRGKCIINQLSCCVSVHTAKR